MSRNCARNFKIRKYAFLIFEKSMSKKIAPRYLRFVGMLFNVIINVIFFSMTGVIGMLGVCIYAFHKYCHF